MNHFLGIRLHNLEVYNWGTFHKKAWNFSLEGYTSLLTGTSGSGKSTLVDALITLLVPPRKVAYNKAADASSKERSVKSYVLGYYGRKYSLEGRGKPEALRDTSNYSVILATFRDLDRKQTTSLAIFFWFKDNETEPNRMYVISNQELFINEDFVNFHSDIRFLRNQLKKKGAKIYDSFPQYGEYYRKQLGNISEQAIELFQQMISVKQVDSLNTFVRTSMLEKEDTEEQIGKLLKHYANLNAAYEAVLKAKKQIDMLNPIQEKGREYEIKIQEKNQIELADKSLEIWFALQRQIEILEGMKKLKEQISKIEQKIEFEKKREEQIAEELKQIARAILENGGQELNRLEDEVSRKKEELDRKNVALEKYNTLAKKLGLSAIRSLEGFQKNYIKIPKIQKDIYEKDDEIQNELITITIQIKQYEEEKKKLEEEIQSLKERTSNLPYHLVSLRNHICKELNIKIEELPFSGELIEVKDSEMKWEGAIERLVHSFAISILVPEKHYSSVSDWVDNEHLGRKLVYFKVDSKKNRSSSTLEENSVAKKLLIKKDTLFTEWMKGEVSKRFPHICCEKMELFRKEIKAITKNGQIKTEKRHEKDDNFNIYDRKKYVLGFSNAKKRKILSEEKIEIENQLTTFLIHEREWSKKKKEIGQLLSAVASLSEYTDYHELDIVTTEEAIQNCQNRILEIKENKSILETLEKQQKEKEEEKNKCREQQNQLMNERGKREGKYKTYEEQQKNNEEKINQETEKDREMYPFIKNDFSIFLEKNGMKQNYSVDYERKYSSDLHSRLSKLQESINRLSSHIQNQMTAFKYSYPNETLELSNHIESLNEYKIILSELLYHNLPKFRENFKNELQGKVIQHISLFHNELYQHRKNILARIQEINDSLKEIDYNLGRYICLNYEETPEADIKIFKNQLRACTEGMTNLEEEVLESKFLQIKEIIEKFKGRKDFSDADKKWTQKVTDIRNWFVFSATERFRENDEEYEHYSDSDGKSGGQKEKLAYTILAAGLSYNYKLNQKERQGSSFRLVVIDEAFLKSSDDSAKFGLQLFEQLRFQLMLVTPLLKISTIEPFISRLGFVTHSEITHESSIKNVSIEEYHEKRQKWEANGFEKMDQDK